MSQETVATISFPRTAAMSFARQEGIIPGPEPAHAIRA